MNQVVTTPRIASVIEGVIAREADYVDHPSDRGGPTRFGITQARARLEGYMGDMRVLPREVAFSIFHQRYVTDPNFDLILDVDEAVGEELIDTGVLMGPAVAATFLQRWLNALNGRGKFYSDLFVDGRVGPATAAALRSYLARRKTEGAAVLLAALNGSQGSRMLDIAERNESQEDFLYGWVRGRVLQKA